MLYKLLLSLVVAVSLAGGIFPALLEPPLSFATSLFYAPSPLALFSVALGIFFFGGEVEEKLGRRHFAGVWLLAGVGSMLVQPAGEHGFAAAAADGFLGAVAAIDPYSMAIIRFIPLPAFALAILMLAFNFLALQQFSPVALLLGLAYGYLAASTAPPAKPAAPARSPAYAYGRY